MTLQPKFKARLKQKKVRKADTPLKDFGVLAPNECRKLMKNSSLALSHLLTCVLAKSATKVELISGTHHRSALLASISIVVLAVILLRSWWASLPKKFFPIFLSRFYWIFCIPWFLAL